MAVDYAYISAGSQGGGTTDTLSVTLAIGDAHADRRVVAAVTLNVSGSPTGRSFTIGGVAASIDRQINPTTFIVSADVPTGTSAAVSCTVTGGSSPTVQSITAAAWRLIGPVLVYDADHAAAFGSSVAFSLDETQGGATIALATSAGTITWSYPGLDAAPSTTPSYASASAAATGTGTVGATGSILITVGAVHYAQAVPVTGEILAQLPAPGFQATSVPVEGALSGQLPPLGPFALVDAGADAEILARLPALGFSGIVEPEIPEDYFTRVLVSRDTGETLVVLATISEASLNEPIRLARNSPGHDIVSNGALYRATYFEVALVSDSDGPPVARIRVPNIDRRVGGLLDLVGDAPTVRLDLVLASNPDRVERSWKALRLQRAAVDESQVDAQLGQTDFSATPFPALAATPALFPALYK